MWRALAAYGNLDAAVHYSFGEYEVQEAKLRSEFGAYAEELPAKAPLERGDVPKSDC